MEDLEQNDHPVKALVPRNSGRKRRNPNLLTKGNEANSARHDAEFDELERARNSLIYWWYRCLQVHEQYQYCCGSGGEGPLAELYKDFGNVLDLQFNSWWYRHGRKAFQEQQPFKKVTEVTGRRQIDFENVCGELLVVAIPLNKRRVTAMREVSKLLADAHEKAHMGKKVDIWKASTAKRQIVKNKVRHSTIEQLLKLWTVRLANPQAKLYEIGPMAGIEIGMYVRSKGDEQLTEDYERRRMTMAVSRLLIQANNLLENAALGIFPSFKTPPKKA